MSRSQPPPHNQPRTVQIRGRAIPFLERRRIGRRDYFLLEQVGNPQRPSFRAFDPRSGPGGDFFLIQRLPRGPQTEQRLRVLRRLKHEAFPRCVEWQRQGESTEVVLTWMKGISLADYFGHLRSGRRPPVAPSEAVRLIRGLANGVSYLHQSFQLAHGDIQPANVLLTDHSSRLTLIDFGSAWTVERTVHREEGDGRHPIYAAPEFSPFNDPGSGFLADQFSVSVLFYELLTGVIPYDGLGGKAGRPELRERAARMLVPPSQVTSNCRHLPRSLRDGVDRVVLRGLALDPDDRYTDRHAWLNDLFELHAKFRLPTEDSFATRVLTRVVAWYSRFRSGD